VGAFLCVILDGKGFIPFYVYTLLQRSVVW